MGLWRWIKDNMVDRKSAADEQQYLKTEEIYLHDEWFDHFQDELKRWKDS